MLIGFLIWTRVLGGKLLRMSLSPFITLTTPNFDQSLALQFLLKLFLGNGFAEVHGGMML